MIKEFGPEQAVHGSLWGQLHGGYFSDPEVARPLIEAVCGAWAQARPDVVVDLGGGTGFLLAQLQNAGLGKSVALVNLDGSPAQLEALPPDGIAMVRGAVEKFRRAEVVPPGRRTLFLMRSVLHYAGNMGLVPLLRHIRAQAKSGEYWIHQTACFEETADANCLNSLYQKMRTGKWYPTVSFLRRKLSAAGWQVVDILPAPALVLASRELGQRYDLSRSQIIQIQREMQPEFKEQRGVFLTRRNTFLAQLHYRIYICRAISR